MSLYLDISIEEEGWLEVLPDLESVTELTLKAGAPSENVHISVLYTDDSSIQEMNAQWRGIDKPTNVLSFENPPMALPHGVPKPLGDIVLSLQTMQREAAADRKTLRAHTQHLLVHGFLHLLGFDHETESDAQTMESEEIRLLEMLSVANPYDVDAS
jgi:probable rRNA maturation factor